MNIDSVICPRCHRRFQPSAEQGGLICCCPHCAYPWVAPPPLVRHGDEQARDDLIEHVCDRLRFLARNMLKSYPIVRRWEQTDDVLQNALIRLHRALSELKPESTLHFYNLATTQIRRELIDLARRYAAKGGFGKPVLEDEPMSPENRRERPRSRSDVGVEPSDLESWSRFHEYVAALPDDERETFGLIWYSELTQDQAANILGVSLRTVKRRWHAARMLLCSAMKDRDRELT